MRSGSARSPRSPGFPAFAASGPTPHAPGVGGLPSAPWVVPSVVWLRLLLESSRLAAAWRCSLAHTWSHRCYRTLWYRSGCYKQGYHALTAAVPRKSVFLSLGQKLSSGRPRSRVGVHSLHENCKLFPKRLHHFSRPPRLEDAWSPEFPGYWATLGVTVCGFNCSRRCKTAFRRGLSLRSLSDE